MQDLDVKPGDNVTIYTGDYILAITKVAAITPAGFIRAGNELYKANGYRHGGNKWGRDYIVPTTKEHRDAIEKRRIIKIILGTSFDKFSLAQLRQIVDVIHEGESKNV